MTEEDVLVGRYFHTLLPDGGIERQGKILAISESRWLIVQWYSFLDGSPNHIASYAKGRVIGPKARAVIYDNVDDWRAAGDEYFKSRSP